MSSNGAKGRHAACVRVVSMCDLLTKHAVGGKGGLNWADVKQETQ